MFIEFLDCLNSSNWICWHIIVKWSNCRHFIILFRLLLQLPFLINNQLSSNINTLLCTKSQDQSAEYIKPIPEEIVLAASGLVVWQYGSSTLPISFTFGNSNSNLCFCLQSNLQPGSTLAVFGPPDGVWRWGDLWQLGQVPWEEDCNQEHPHRRSQGTTWVTLMRLCKYGRYLITFCTLTNQYLYSYPI